MKEHALKDLLFRMADDLLILGHRNSEWTGLGPLLEEDIAFSSMAQDKIGQSLALYKLLHEVGEAAPDPLAFTRPATQFKNCQLVELPNDEYDFSLVRHFLFDTADALRWEALTKSAYEPLAQLARKVRGELRYHTLHANTWMKQLGSATVESKQRLQQSLDRLAPYALGMFETTSFEQAIIENKIFPGEKTLFEQWHLQVNQVLSVAGLESPDWTSCKPVNGGRHGIHSTHLAPLLAEMTAVFSIDPNAEW
ncbi:MAG TPA: phenylacetate-CoA oxygenase subunit PaaC [Cyclobacteriaceae bacterium]|nr:phenylacetate-CoA oxygenase subunit PaaC [Cyclobacteriaceae bacterium]